MSNDYPPGISGPPGDYDPEQQVTNEILLQDISAIEELRLKAPAGKITLLTGPNGVGKTKALEAIQALASGKGRLERRDGTTGGRVEGFGVTIKVSRGTHRSGELEVESVEDHLNIAQLVDPGLADPTKNDARRIKALVTLAGVEAKPELFYGLAGGKEQFLKIVGSSQLDQADLVAMAAYVKRNFEAESRREAAIAENLGSQIRTAHSANEGIDLEAPHDADELQAALEQSIKNLATEQQRASDAQDALDVARMARGRLEESEAEYDGHTVEEANAHLDTLIARGAGQQKIIDQLNLQLRAATREIEDLARRQETARETVRRAQDHESSITRWEADVAAAESVEPPNSVVIAALDAAVSDARSNAETGVRVRDARQRAAAADLLVDQRKDADANARRYRDAAHGTEDILSRLVADMGGPLSVDKDFRLCVDKYRDKVYFARLSHGERWKLALDIAIGAFQKTGQRGLLAIPQDAWEGLDADNRRLIAEHIEDSDLAIVTAEASREEHADAAVGVSQFE